MRKILAVLAFIVAISGITLFDIVIVDLPFFETPFSKKFKKAENQGTRVPYQLPEDREGTKLSVPRLIGILDDLILANKKLTFIETNVDRMPNRLSLADLNRILDLFLLDGDKLKVTKAFQSRIEDNYSDAEFEKFKYHYILGSNRIEAINLLIRK